MPRSARRSFSGNGHANASLFGLIVAVGVFTIAFGTVVHESIRRTEGSELAVALDHRGTALRIAETIVGTPGLGWYGADGACIDGALDPDSMAADGVQQMGLAEEPCIKTNRGAGALNNLSFTKIENLYAAQMGADGANGHVDYDEATRGLLLDGTGLDFHLRSWPILPSISSRLDDLEGDPNLRVLYIGDYDQQWSGPPVDPTVQHTAGVVDSVAEATFWVNVTNNGTTPTAFSVVFEVPLKNRLVVELHTPKLAVDEAHLVELALPKTNDWAWAQNSDEAFAYTVRGVSDTLGEGEVARGGLD